jgi:ankyrin repeat protein
VWLCEHYNAYFSSTEEFKNLPVWNRFFLLCQFPFLSYKELIKDWQKQALNDLCTLIYITPGRTDFFEAYARQGLPFRGQAEGEGIEGGPTPMCFLAANFNNNNTDIGTGIELTRFLHENGADVNEYSGNGSLPLTNAITKRSLNLVNLLLELGADPNKTHVFAPLLWALFQSEDSEIEEVRIEIAKSLLEHKANANVVHNDVTPLMLALYFESPEKVELVSRLLAAGANVNKANSEGITPLMMAVVKYGNNNNNESKKNDLQVIELLLKNGAKTEVLTTNGYWSPLMRAADLDAYDAAELLIKYGAKKEFADKEAITAFGYASFKQHKKTAVLLDPGHSLVTKARLLSAGKVALSVLTIAWVFLTMDVLAKVILSFHFIYPVLLGASILISHLLAAYLLIIIHGLHVFLIKLRGTFSFISSGLFYIVSIPIAFPLLVALLQALTRLLPENVTAKLSIPEEILTRSSSFAMFSLYILFLALFMGAVLFFSKITGRFNKIMQIYRQFT